MTSHGCSLPYSVSPILLFVRRGEPLRFCSAEYGVDSGVETAGGILVDYTVEPLILYVRCRTRGKALQPCTGSRPTRLLLISNYCG